MISREGTYLRDGLLVPALAVTQVTVRCLPWLWFTKDKTNHTVFFGISNPKVVPQRCTVMTKAGWCWTLNCYHRSWVMGWTPGAPFATSEASLWQISGGRVGEKGGQGGRKIALWNNNTALCQFCLWILIFINLYLTRKTSLRLKVSFSRVSLPRLAAAH